MTACMRTIENAVWANMSLHMILYCSSLTYKYIFQHNTSPTSKYCCQFSSWCWWLLIVMESKCKTMPASSHLHKGNRYALGQHCSQEDTGSRIRKREWVQTIKSHRIDFVGDIAFRAKYWVLQSALDRIVLGEEGKNSFFSYFHILLTTLVQRGNVQELVCRTPDRVTNHNWLYLSPKFSGSITFALIIIF